MQVLLLLSALLSALTGAFSVPRPTDAGQAQAQVVTGVQPEKRVRFAAVIPVATCPGNERVQGRMPLQALSPELPGPLATTCLIE